MRKLVIFATVALALSALGAVFPVPRDGRGHLITEYVGVFQAPESAGGSYMSIIYYDGRLYAATRGAHLRACSIAFPSADQGMMFLGGMPESYEKLKGTGFGPSIRHNAPVFASDLNGLQQVRRAGKDSSIFWARVSDTANLWDMYRLDEHGNQHYCVPDALVTSGSHSFPQGSAPAVITRPAARPTRGP